ncbi:MAG: BatD family protein [Carboxylicivirga sp.]|nr:BatD family protein [Carboxylicivirga sp.]
MRLSLLTILLFATSLVWVNAQDVKFTARSQSAVVAGDKFQLVYTLNKEGSDIRLPSLQDFQILMGPSTSYSNQTSIINGKVSRETNYTYTYILKAGKEGDHTIPPATIKVDGEKVSSNAVKIKVLKAGSKPQTNQQNSASGSAPGADELFITVSPSKKTVYQGEPLVLTTKIYTKVQLEDVSDINQPKLSDFIVQSLRDKSKGITWTMENKNGRNYNVAIFDQKLAFPQKTGKLKIEPTDIEFLVQQRVAPSRSRSIFDDFFESRYRTVKKRVKSKPITINVKPLPATRPEGFTGGVGQLNMSASVSKTDVKVNDGITLTVKISGTGNHKFIQDPAIKIPADFDEFDPKISNSGLSNMARGMQGVKTYEYLMIPRHAGTFTIPAVKFAYFDPAKGKYQTISSKAITINVEKGEGDETAGGGIVRSNVNKENVKFLGKDIRYIKTNAPKLKPTETFFIGSLIFYVSLLLPFSLFILLFIINQKRIRENANVTLMKTKKANKVAIKRLKKSAQLLKTGEKEAFYEEVLRALWGYLSDRLSIPLSELSKDNAGEILKQSNVSTEVIREIMEILDTCEFARYAPASGTGEMDKLYNQTIATISKLENQIKR